MQRFILMRCVQAFFSILVLSAIVFGMARLSGSPVDLLILEHGTQEDRVRLEKHLGLDKPVVVQYWLFVSRAVRGDFGESIRARRPVFDVIMERFPATLQLGSMAILMMLFIALPIGVYAAVKRGSLLDLLGRGMAVFGQAAPMFWLGIMLIYIFAVGLQILPTGGRGGIQHLILPAITLGWYMGAGIMRLTRSSMLNVLDSEYVKLARLKGLPESVVIWKHAFKNAALPILTFAMILFVLLLHGSVIVETVFAWPGLGRLAIQAIRWRDYPVVQAVVLVFSVMFIVGNLLADILYGYLNPKIRYQK
ncbi:ABC transporter permease [Chloroflexota bacterium]